MWSNAQRNNRRFANFLGFAPHIVSCHNTRTFTDNREGHHESRSPEFRARSFSGIDGRPCWRYGRKQTIGEGDVGMDHGELGSVVRQILAKELAKKSDG